MRVQKSMQCYQVFAYMTAVTLDHRLDSARQEYQSGIALQSYNEINGILAYFFRI